MYHSRSETRFRNNVRELAPFGIDPSRIATLPTNVFTRLCNEFIRAEAGRVALPQSFVDADGRETAGTFSGGESLTIEPGDLIALFDGGGAVVDTVSV